MTTQQNRTLSDFLASPDAPVGPARTRLVDVNPNLIAQPQPDFYSVAAARVRGNGVSVDNELFQDARYLTQRELEAKYGSEEAQRIVNLRAGGMASFLNDSARTRSGVGIAGDTVTGVIGGAIGGIGGIAALGGGLINEDLGAGISGFTDAVTGDIRDAQTDGLNVRRRASQAQSFLSSLDNRATYERERVQQGETIASLRRIGRNFSDEAEITLSDGALVGDSISQGVGSLISGGIVSGGLKAVGRAAISRIGAGRTAAVAVSNPQLYDAAVRTGQVLDRARMPLAIGALEGGGAYTATVEEIRAMSHDDLLANSSLYRELISEGVNPERAKARVMNSGGLTAAAIQAPIGVATGALVSRFEANPFRIGSAATGASNIVREGIEEGIQSGTGQFAQNVGTRTADNNNDLLAGVGEASAKGAIAGAGTGAVFAAPSAVMGTTQEVGRAGIQAIQRGVSGLIAKGEATNNRDVVDTQAQTAASVRDVVAPTRVVTPDPLIDLDTDTRELEENNAILVPLEEQFRFNPETYQPRNNTEAVLLSRMDDPEPDIFTAMTAAVRDINNKETSPKQKIELAQFIDSLQERVTGESLGQVFQLQAKAAAGGSLAKSVTKIIAAQEAITSNPAFLDAITASLRSVPEVKLEDVQNLSTPEGQQAAKTAALQAVYTPEAVSEEVVDALLRNPKDSTILFSRNQLATLRFRAALNQTLKQAEADAAALGLKAPESVRVAREVQVQDPNAPGSAGPSVLGHYELVNQAMKRGDWVEATNRLEEFRNFAQHFANKIGAVNDSFLRRDGEKQGYNPKVAYQAYSQATKSWYNNDWQTNRFDSKLASQQTSQQVGIDGEYVIRSFNELAKLNSEFGVQPVEEVRLNDALRVPARQVFEEAKRQDFAEKNPDIVEQRAEAAPTVETQSEPEPQKEAKAEPTVKNPEERLYDAEKIKAGTDAQILSEIEKLENRALFSDPLSTDAANLKTLKAERDRREDALVVEPSVVVEDTAEAALAPSPKVVEAVAEPEAKPEVTATEETTAEARKLPVIEDLFPDVIKGTDGSNLIVDGFVVDSNAASLLVGENGLNADEVANIVTDTNTVTNSVSAGFASILKEVAGKLLPALQTSIDGNSKYNNKSFWTQPGINRWVSMKLLNFMTEVDGKLSYTPFVQEVITLAMSDWLARNSVANPLRDKDDIRKALRLGPNGHVTSEMEAAFNDGLTISEARRSLTKTLQSFMGIKAKSDVRDGFTGAVIKSLAIEMIEIAAKQRLVSVTTIGEKEQTRVFVSVNKKELGLNESSADISAQPTLISETVLQDKFIKGYSIDERNTGRAKGKQKNTNTSTTPAQDQVEKREGDVPQTVNVPFVELIRSLGSDGVIDLLGEGRLDESAMNINDYRSKQGRNTAFAQAFNVVFGLIDQMGMKALKDNKDLTAVQLFREYAFSSVNRLQQQGQYGDQASKLTREMITPMAVTIDLTADADLMMWRRGIAQAFGFKIDKEAVSNWSGKLDEYLKKDTTKAALQALKAQVKPADFVQILKNAGVETTVHLHALQSYAQFQESKDLSQFFTHVYVEADGMTDGPTNSMLYMRIGGFDADMVRGLARGGIVFSAEPKSAADIFEPENGQPLVGKEKLVETYQNAANILSANLGQKIKDVISAAAPGMEGALNKQASAVIIVLNRLMSAKDFEFKIEDGKAEFTIGRGVLKNPLTISLYGSSARGIANNIAEEILKQLYADLTKAYSADPTGWSKLMFIEDAKGDLNEQTRLSVQFWNALAVLGQSSVQKDFGKWKIEPTGVKIPPVGSINPLTFTVNAKGIANIADALLAFYVDPMIQTISQVMGTSMEGSKLIQETSNFMSALARTEIQRVIYESVDAHVRNGGKASDGVSPDEVKKALQRVAFLLPYMEGDLINLDIKGLEAAQYAPTINKNTGKREPARASASISNVSADPMEIDIPGLAGVGGGAKVNISYGDGRMIIAASPKMEGGRGMVFDGINTNLKDAFRNGQAINKAVIDVITTGTPFRDLLTPYENAVETLNLDAFGPVELDEIFTAVFGSFVKKQGDGRNQIEMKMRGLLTAMQSAALDEQARQAVFAKVHISSDHMAAIGAPASTANDGTNREDLSGLSYEAMAKRLQALFVEERALLEKDTEVPAANKLEPTLDALVEHESGVKLTTTDRLLNVLNSVRIPKQQEMMIRRAVESLKGPWTVAVTDVKEKASAFAKASGIAHVFKNGDFGLTSMGDQTVIVADGSYETLAHELIHAATFEKIEAYMENPMLVDETSREAIARLEALQNEWLDVVDDVVSLRDAETAQTVANVKQTISSLLAEGNKAAALNEFMAWNLSNEKLTKLNATIPVVSKLVRIAKEVMNALRSLLNLPVLGRDFNSNIRFNTMILMSKELPTPQNRAATQLLMHSSNTRPDLDRLMQKMAVVLKKADMGYTGWLGTKPSQLALRAAITLSHTVTRHGFDLTNEERRAFVVMISAFRVNMVKDPAFAMKMNRLHRELLAQMNQTNLASGDPMDPAVNAIARAREALLNGSVDVGVATDDTSLLVPMFAALAAVSPEARDIFSKIEVRSRKKGDKGKSFDESVVGLSDEAMNTIMDFTLGLKPNQKIGEEVDKLVAGFVDQVDKEKNLLQAGLEVPGRLVNQLNDKITDAVSFGLGKVTDALDVVIGSTADGTLANNAAQTAKVAAQLFDKNQYEEGIDQLMSWADSNEAHPELRAILTSLVGSNETNQDVFVLIKQGRAIIDKVRETYRRGIPSKIIKSFTRELTKNEWANLHLLGQLDMHSLVGRGMTDSEVVDLLSSSGAVTALIGQKAAAIQRLFGAKAPAILDDAADLASLLLTKKAAHGLVKKNAMAIANRAGETNVGSYDLTSEEVQTVDAYVSLLALSQIAPDVSASLAELSVKEKKGVATVLSLMAKARAKEMTRVPDRHRFNVPKGYVPVERLGSFKAVAADNAASYTRAGYNIVGSRVQSSVEALYDARAKDIVYVATDLAGPSLKQGILRTIRPTIFGLDAVSGQSYDNPSAGLIVETKAVQAITRAFQRKNAAHATLSPLFNEQGQIYAYERLVDIAEVENTLETQKNAAVSLGQWMGRQHEEIHAEKINEILLSRLTDMWDRAGRQARTNEFVDLFELAKTDPVVASALDLMSDKDKETVKAKMNGKFMVRNSMYQNVIGFHSMSVGDLWTGNTGLKEENREALVNFVTGLLGQKAYRYLTMSETAWTNLMSDARVAIVVKSMIVPALNAMANFYQLMANGIGPVQIAQKTAEYLRETHLHAKNQMEFQRLSVELAIAEGAKRPDRVRVIETELRKIEDLNKKLAIWPLIEAGEFSQITEGLSEDDMDLSRGRVWDYVSKMADKLPPAVKTAGRYALITKDTALFAGLARAVSYTDFVAKAVLYDHLTNKKKQDKKTALLSITNEFVNYDILDGRAVSYAESIGLLWFFKFKMRSIKVAAGLIRNNPLHTFLSSLVPGSYEAGTVMDDNGINLLLDGRLDNATGFDNAWRAVETNPLVRAFG